MKTILGAGGAIGTELAKSLTQYTQNIRLVSRQPKAVNESDQLFPADLTKPEEVVAAVEGSDVAYLTVGLPYEIKIWESTWPVVMQNVIDACKIHGTRLVFFDNIYMYDPVCMADITEEAPIRPVSKKGMVREKIARMLMEAVEKGAITALIARSADFYGPSISKTSVLTETVMNNLARGKKAQWLVSLDCLHSFTYTPDAGRATAFLGITESAYDQVWHLPTTSDPPTGKEWIDRFAEEMGVKPGYQVAPKWLIRAMGLFMPIMKELPEMMYQYDRDYVFNSSKFENEFIFQPTSYQEGIRQIVETDYRTTRIKG